MGTAFPVKAIASHNGLEATKLAYEMLTAGADTLDAVVAGVTLVEDDPHETSVGLGGLPNEDGVVELDAAVMHGPTHRGGGVAAVQKIRHVAKLAQLVMQRTDHVLLVGDGALQFARAHGFCEENLLTEKARKIWLYWKETRSDRDDWIAPPLEELDPEVREFFEKSLLGQTNIPRDSVKRPSGTIHCAGINAKGEISCVTTTSGLAFSLAGRVGDSPILGAGLYVDQSVGSCGSTGRGEANLVSVSSAVAVELMRHGYSPEEAGLELLRRIASRTPKRLLNEHGQPDFGLNFYLIAADGRHAGVTMHGPRQYAITDADGTRLEPSTPLFVRE